MQSNQQHILCPREQCFVVILVVAILCNVIALTDFILVIVTGFSF